MNITILNITKATATSAAGKPYQTIEVAYKDSFGKVASKKLLPFGAQKGSFDALQAAVAGQSYNLTVVKNDKGYNDWTNAVLGTSPMPAASVGTGSNAQSTNVQVKSTYETPTERALKQTYIVRQSSISSAIDTLSVGAKSVSPDDVLKLASRYYDYVFQSPEDVAMQDVVALPNDIAVL